MLLMHLSGSVAFPQVTKKFRREAMGVVDTRDSTGENPYAGGAGAMVQGVLSVTAGETLTIIVGEGGGMLRRATYGGGGAEANNNSSGGGRSAIRRGGVDLVTAGAGGGGGAQRPDYYEGTSFGGSATFSGTANNGYATTGYGQAYAYGGSQTAGGARVRTHIKVLLFPADLTMEVVV